MIYLVVIVCLFVICTYVMVLVSSTLQVVFAKNPRINMPKRNGNKNARFHLFSDKCILKNVWRFLAGFRKGMIVRTQYGLVGKVLAVPRPAENEHNTDNHSPGLI